ncbi:MAG TPA: hypothetical protein VHA52_05725 [Candidatus Babeliaceae bacterium]|nr:hypothetical protein [Candidatus Babeliaceae bacterium]
MKKIVVIEKNFDASEITQLKKQVPNTLHGEMLIDHEALVYNNGKLVAVYLTAPFDTEDVRLACQQLKFHEIVRESGIVSRTIHIGASGRNPRLDNRCWLSQFARSNPQIHVLFEKTARQVSKIYHAFFRDTFLDQVAATYSGPKKVHSQYRIKATPFTGGVINKDTEIPYHFDTANINGGISCMVIFKKNQAGGELVLPQLNIRFACHDGYLLLFDGKKYLHGVTPILKMRNVKGYRYTIVYYKNAGMEICLPPEEEELHYQEHLEGQSEKRYKNNLLKG